MHYIVPLVIMFGAVGVIEGLLWLVATGSDRDDGPDTGLFFIFGTWYLALRVMKQLVQEPMSVLPAFAILLVGAGLIWLGVMML